MLLINDLRPGQRAFIAVECFNKDEPRGCIWVNEFGVAYFEQSKKMCILIWRLKDGKLGILKSDVRKLRFNIFRTPPKSFTEVIPLDRP